MQKNQKIIIGVLIVFVLAAIIFFLSYGKKDIEDTTPDVATSTATTTVSTFEIKVETLKDSESAYDVLIEYPQFTTAATGTVEERLNAQFKKEAQATFEEGSAEMKQASTGMEGREIILEKKLQKDKTYINNETGIMSVVYMNYVDTGGAHGTSFYTSETIDLKAGKKLVLADFLGELYVAPLVKELNRQIRTAATTCLRCDRLTDELQDLKVEIPDQYVFSDQGITFLFGAYELGSYAATASGQEIFVDKVFLKDYILRNW